LFSIPGSSHTNWRLDALANATHERHPSEQCAQQSGLVELKQQELMRTAQKWTCKMATSTEQIILPTLKNSSDHATVSVQGSGNKLLQLTYCDFHKSCTLMRAKVHPMDREGIVPRPGGGSVTPLMSRLVITGAARFKGRSIMGELPWPFSIQRECTKKRSFLQASAKIFTVTRASGSRC
jgi:hypothetical protein